jgi:predicted RND superfamily exporter protein
VRPRPARALTTIAGFGSLAFTSHRGLASFALVLTLGVAFALVFSLLVLPSMLRLAAPRGTGSTGMVVDDLPALGGAQPDE